MDDKKILLALRRLLMREFPGKIERIILFGSRAYGKAGPSSDYDILILLNSDYNWRLKQSIQEVCWEIDYKYDILTDVKVISQTELKTIRGKQPFITNALQHGIAV